MTDSTSRAAPGARLTRGQRFPALALTSITGQTVNVPDLAGRTVHLQFRRFAGCPICNLHLRTVTARIAEIDAAGIVEVVVFHSTDAELRTYQDGLPFTVIGDPERVLYRRFGVESSARSVLSLRTVLVTPRAWWHMIGTAVRERRAPMPATPTGGSLGLPADVLVAADGTVLAVTYGTHAYDQWPVDTLLANAAAIA